MTVTQKETYYLIRASYKDAQGWHSASFEFQSENKDAAKGKVVAHLQANGFTDISTKANSHKGKVYAAPGL